MVWAVGSILVREDRWRNEFKIPAREISPRFIHIVPKNGIAASSGLVSFVPF